MGFWNWKAALLFCSGILIARLCVHFLPQPIVGVIVGYGLLAAVSAFFVDVIAGLVFAVISLLTVVQLFVPPFVGFVEITLIAGMVTCLYDGGSGGIYRGSDTLNSGRLAAYIPVLAVHRDPVAKD